MTRKDFIAIAEALKDGRMASAPKDFKLATMVEEQRELIQAASEHARIHDSMARALAAVCARTNPRFNRSKFLAACGVEGY